MGWSFSIWSQTPTAPEQVFIDLVKAAYLSKCSIYLHKVNEYVYSDNHILEPVGFQIKNNLEDNVSMIFNFVREEEQYLLKKEFQFFKDQTGNRIYLDEIYEIASSDEVNAEISFNLMFEYLRINQDQYVYIDYLINWPLAQLVKKQGYAPDWWVLR